MVKLVSRIHVSHTAKKSIFFIFDKKTLLDQAYCPRVNYKHLLCQTSLKLTEIKDFQTLFRKEKR